MSKDKLSAKDATEATMKEVQGPIIATIAVLASIFIPVAFIGGVTSVLYKQFAVTITISVVISAFVALTLTPALCCGLPHLGYGPHGHLLPGPAFDVCPR